MIEARSTIKMGGHEASIALCMDDNDEVTMAIVSPYGSLAPTRLEIELPDFKGVHLGLGVDEAYAIGEALMRASQVVRDRASAR